MTQLTQDIETGLEVVGSYKKYLELTDGVGWDDLDKLEDAAVQKLSHVDDVALDLEKILRIIEYRRGQALGPAQPGKRTDLMPDNLRHAVAEVSEGSRRRYRTIAEHWDEIIWPHLLQATQRHEVTQAAILRLIETGSTKRLPEPTRELPVKVTVSTTEQPKPSDEEDEPDLAAELQRMQGEIDQLNRELVSMESDDTNKEIRKLHAQIAQLNARLNGLLNEKKAAVDTAERYDRLLKRIAKAAGVERYADIIPAIEKARAA